MNKRVLASICVIVSAVLLVLPWSVKVRFFGDGGKEIIGYYSALSMIPVSVGNWFALSGFLMNAVAAPLSVSNINTNVSKQVTVLLIISVNLMLISWIMFGSFSVVSVASFLCQIVAMGMLKKRK